MIRPVPGGWGRCAQEAGRAVPLLLLLLLPLAPRLSAQITPRFPSRQFDAIPFRDAFWLATPQGLYQYRTGENVWSVRNERNGLLSRVVTRIAADGDALWIGQDRGVTVSNFQTNTYLSFDSARGIPPGRVLCFAFEPDYVWVGTESGAARYDRLIEEWQGISAAQGLTGSRVCEIIPREKLVYLVTEKGVNEYDVRYERWRVYGEGERMGNIRDAFATSSNIWLFCDRELVRFDYTTKSFQHYPLGEIGTCEDILELVREGEGFWIFTGKGLWSYDPSADAIRPFLEIAALPDPNLHGIAFSQDGTTIWFNTGAGVSRFDRATKAWQHYTEASGMPVSLYRALFCHGSELLGVASAEIAYLKPEENRWYRYPLLAEGEKQAALSIDPAHGTYADFGEGYRLDASGTRSSWLAKTGGAEPGSLRFGRDIETVGRNDLRARLTLPGGRTINAMYNDADFSDLQYGAQYRGAQEDLIQSVQAGDIRIDRGPRALLPTLGIFGGGGRMTMGDKTERYRRSLLEVAAVTGHKTTGAARDQFHGRMRDVRAAVRDVDFARELFYRLDAADRDIRVEKGSVRIFMTSVPSLAGKRDILPQKNIGGIDGEWFLLREGAEYFVDADRGILRCLASTFNSTGRLGAASLVAEYLPLGESLPRLVVLASANAPSREMKNVYFLGAAGIYPGSLRVEFTHKTLGTLPLSRFGLDANGDGVIDPEFVDYLNGYLRFPTPFPFAPDAYADSAVSSVTMDVRCETSVSGYRLSHDHLIRGSETIAVDGSPARAGSDYVLDYTSGFLLFTRDGVVNDDSRIEVEYEYVRNRPDERLTQATATLSPSDNTQAALSVVRYHPERDSAQVTTIQGMLEGRIQTEGADLRVMPEYALMTGGKEFALHLLAAFSTGPVRLSAQARRLSEGYREPFRRLFSAGRLLEEKELHGEFDATASLRFFTDWKARSGRDTLTGEAGRDEYGTLGAQWFGSGLPSVTLRAEHLLDNAHDSTMRRRGFRADLEYVPGPGVVRALGLSSLLLSSYARYMRGEEYNPGGGRASFEYRNYYLRTAISPLPLFTLNAYYRGDRKSLLLPDGDFGPANTLQKLFGDMVFEEVRGLSLALRYTRDLETMHLPICGSPWDESSRHSFQIATRFSPGILLDFFAPFTLEWNYRDERSAYAKGGFGNRPFFASLFAAGNGAEVAFAGSRVYETRVEWRPVSVAAYYLTGRLTESLSGALASSAKEVRRELTQRFDFQPGSRELYSARMTILQSRSFNDSFIRYAPALWLENRWSTLLLTRFTFDLQWDDQENGPTRTRNRVYTPGANVTLTLVDPPIVRRVELREDISFRRRDIRIDGPLYTASYALIDDSMTNTLYLDIYPHPALYLRLLWSYQWGLTTFWYQTDASLQATLQL